MSTTSILAPLRSIDLSSIDLSSIDLRSVDLRRAGPPRRATVGTLILTASVALGAVLAAWPSAAAPAREPAGAVHGASPDGHSDRSDHSDQSGQNGTSGPIGRDQRPGVWPLRPQPSIGRGFAPPSGPFARGHRGVDLLGRPGQLVLSPLPGRVVFSGLVGGVPVVTIAHGDGLRTTYQPVTGRLPRGARVGRGTLVGTLLWRAGHCGSATCLHWGALRDGTYVDPLALVAVHVVVRLVPE